jgi:transcriptional regulator with XRE-family HTH domain
MTGTGLREWRKSHGWTQEQVAEFLRDVGSTTVSRWEKADETLPNWATEKLLTKTTLALPIDELHSMLDYARAQDMSFEELLSEAVREYLSRRKMVTSTSVIAEDAATYDASKAPSANSKVA